MRIADYDEPSAGSWLYQWNLLFHFLCVFPHFLVYKMLFHAWFVRLKCNQLALLVPGIKTAKTSGQTQNLLLRSEKKDVFLKKKHDAQHGIGEYTKGRVSSCMKKNPHTKLDTRTLKLCACFQQVWPKWSSLLLPIRGNILVDIACIPDSSTCCLNCVF